jgi:phosphatidylethanolamine-binding protein (PEBP) family uncharacterized protein
MTATDTVAAAFVTHGVFPDVVDAFEFAAGVSAAYNGGKDKVTVGCELPPAKAKVAPAVTATEGTRADALYTWLMVDPDAPSRAAPKYREWLHWIVANCPGGAATAATATTVCPYMGPAPPKGTGKHRYVLLLCEQLAGRVPDTTRAENRPSFSARAWIAKHNLKPISATFFFAQN